MAARTEFEQTPEQRARRQLIEDLRLIEVREAAETDPKALINEIKFYDPASEQYVEFKMFPPEGWVAPIDSLPNGEFEFQKNGVDDWFWQSLIIDWFHDPKIKKYLILKARQLGITLMACAYALWLMLYRPGSVCVAYSYEEGEARKLVEACWMMFQALPPVLRNNVEVITPTRTDMPSEWIRLRHKNGKISSFQALPATKKHGHGARVTFAIMDEVAYMDYAKRIYTAINPAVSRGKAKLLLISTAFGVGNPETGEGSYFHVLWATRKLKKLAYLFLPWNLEPTRDDKWYQTEAMALDEVERNQQYPLNENDAFMLSGALYFDRDSLAYYSENVAKPIKTGHFVPTALRSAKFMNLREGLIDVYELPRSDGKYGLAVDMATGKGLDHTAMGVIDLETGAMVAELHAGKGFDAVRAAFQAHYLGRWYNTAKIAPERQGGYGDALIAFLRDGHGALPAYPNIYRHTSYTSGNKPIDEEYGMPMGPKNREMVIQGLKYWIYTRQFPWVSSGLRDELGTFVYRETAPSPAAQDGTNDDRVLMAAIAVDLFRQFGSHPEPRKKSWKKHKYTPPPTRRMT